MKKKILILGASSDIGLATAIKFLKNDWHVIAHCNKNSSKLLKLKKKFTLKLEILKIDLNQISKFPNRCLPHLNQKLYFTYIFFYAPLAVHISIPSTTLSIIMKKQRR